MADKLAIKVTVSGKKITLQGPPSTPISSILGELKKSKHLSTNANHDLAIINTFNYEQLKINSKLSDIVPDATNTRSIQIREKQQASRKKNIQSVNYDITIQEVYSQAIMKVMSDDYQAIVDLGIKKKISPYFQSLLLKLLQKQKSGQSSPSKNQSKSQSKIDQAKQTQIKKLLGQLSQKQTQCKLLQIKNTQLENILQEMKLKNQEDNKIRKDNTSAAVQLDKYKSMYNQKVEEINSMKQIHQTNIKTLKQSVTKPISGQLSFSQILPNSDVSVSHNDTYLLSLVNKKQLDTRFPLFHRSSTFSLEEFRNYLPQYSLILRNLIQNFKKSTIKDVFYHFFASGATKEKFMEKVKNKSSFVLLFTVGTQIFGIYSTDALEKVHKSSNGFLFSLNKQKIYPLKKEISLWKFSNIQIKIGNDALIFSEPIKKDPVPMKMNKKKSIKDSFEINDPQIKEIFGNDSCIEIKSFEMLTVAFTNQSNEIKMQKKQKIQQDH